MPSSAFTLFNGFRLRLCKGEHHLHAAGDVVKVYLTNNTPSVTLDDVKADLVGITEENGYAATDVENDVSETGGVVTLSTVDYIEFTVITNPLSTFRYAVLYNDTHASDALIGYFDYGSALTPGVGEKFKIDFNALGTIDLSTPA